MRSVDELTQPIPATDTARHHRWPTTNELIDLDTPPSVPVPAIPEAIPAPRPPSGRFATRAITDPPLPDVGDYLGTFDTPSPIPVGPVMRVPSPIPAPLPRRSRTCTTALILALMSVPLLLVFGLGAIVGAVAVGAGIAGIARVNGNPGVYRGSGSGVGAIIVGTGSVIVGSPFLLITLGIIALL